MNKLSHALVLTAALALGGAVPAARAYSILSLAPTALPASTFNSDFAPVTTAPEMSSPFQFAGAPVSGVMESEVFQGRAGTPAANFYAYAYQIGVNPGATSSTGDPAHVDSASFHFGNTLDGTDLTNSGHESLSYVVTDGRVGNLSLPQAAPGGVIQTPTELSWIGDLRAKFEDQTSGSPPLTPGAKSATFIILSGAPQTQEFVNLQSSDPQVPNFSNPNGNPFTTVYAPTVLQIFPVPEPATLLAWSGMTGAVALVRRVRKSRAEDL
jgi:hypothetical protein